MPTPRTKARGVSLGFGTLFSPWKNGSHFQGPRWSDQQCLKAAHFSPPLAMPQKEGYKAPFVQAAPVQKNGSQRAQQISYNKNSHQDSIAIAGFHTKENNQKSNEGSELLIFLQYLASSFLNCKMMQDAIKTKQASLLNVTCCFSQVGFLDLDADGLLESGESALVNSKWKWTQ